ncbi:MAG: dihydropteroate synthase [Alphaproteobacteria bacterium]|nr:dihydropteroate synthase [Alphaproteobacteria bacterium]
MAHSKLIIPTGFIYGDEAKIAIASQLALPIAGGSVGFCMAKIINRCDDDIGFMSVAELLASDDVEIIAQLEAIGALRPRICGLDMSQQHIMGILNLTPDSFSDGGSHDDVAKLERQIDDHIKCGLSVVDVGGESTRPKASYVSCEQEIVRIAPILSMLKSKDICVSIDTRKAKVMDYALAHGADMINDVSALEFRADVAQYGEDSGDSVQAVLKAQCPIILMHSQGTPETMQNDPHYENILFEIYDYLQARIENLVKQGFDRSKIVIDPGIGFGKTVAHCLTILDNLSLFHSLGVALLVGSSRKSFIGVVAGEKDVGKRQAGSLAAMSVAKNTAVQFHRMHDIKVAQQHMSIINSIRKY